MYNMDEKGFIIGIIGRNKGSSPKQCGTVRKLQQPFKMETESE